MSNFESPLPHRLQALMASPTFKFSHPHSPALENIPNLKSNEAIPSDADESWPIDQTVPALPNSGDKIEDIYERKHRELCANAQWASQDSQYESPYYATWMETIQAHLAMQKEKTGNTFTSLLGCPQHITHYQPRAPKSGTVSSDESSLVLGVIPPAPPGTVTPADQMRRYQSDSDDSETILDMQSIGRGVINADRKEANKALRKLKNRVLPDFNLVTVEGRAIDDSSIFVRRHAIVGVTEIKPPRTDHSRANAIHRLMEGQISKQVNYALTQEYPVKGCACIAVFGTVWWYQEEHATVKKAKGAKQTSGSRSGNNTGVPRPIPTNVPSLLGRKSTGEDRFGTFVMMLEEQVAGFSDEQVSRELDRVLVENPTGLELTTMPSYYALMLVRRRLQYFAEEMWLDPFTEEPSQKLGPGKTIAQLYMERVFSHEKSLEQLDRQRRELDEKNAIIQQLRTAQLTERLQRTRIAGAPDEESGA